MYINEGSDMIFKGNNLKVQDIDEANKKVLIYVSSFGDTDSDKDIIIPGAYQKTLSERGPVSQKPRIKHLRDHWDLIGKPIEMTEDQKGLLVLSQLSNSTAGRDTIEDYKLNLLEHSVGFEIMKSDPRDEKGIQIIREIKLWEYSSVSWGANENTPLVEMKGKDVTEVITRINAKMDRLSTALRKGDYSDERFEQIEVQLQIIKTAYNDIIKSLQPPKSTDEPKLDLASLGEIFDNFNKKLK